MTQPPHQLPHPSNDHVVAEYSALRAEFLYRISQRDNFVLFSITALGAIFGIDLSTEHIDVSSNLLVIPALLNYPLAVYWAHSDHAIARIGNYIRIYIEKSNTEFRWETYLLEARTIKNKEWVIYRLPKRYAELCAYLTFTGGSLISLGLYVIIVVDSQQLRFDTVRTIAILTCLLSSMFAFEAIQRRSVHLLKSIGSTDKPILSKMVKRIKNIIDWGWREFLGFSLWTRIFGIWFGVVLIMGFAYLMSSFLQRVEVVFSSFPINCNVNDCHKDKFGTNLTRGGS